VARFPYDGRVTRSDSAGGEALQRTVMFVLVLLDLAFAAAAAGQSDACQASFRAKGSVFSRISYTADDDLADVSAKVGLERLQRQLGSKDVKIVSVDAEHGTLNGSAAVQLGSPPRSCEVALTITPSSNGSHVTMVVSLPPRKPGFGFAEIRQWMCEVIALAASEGEGAGQAAVAPPPPPADAEPPAYQPQEAPLSNADILSLTAAGLGSELIVAKIKQAPAVSFDVSTDALIDLRKKKVASSVIGAMLQRASERSKPPAP
jgi:hypothetical protein